MPLHRNRGVLIRIHASGMRVAMYADSPGSYVDTNGNPVSEDVAREAGFNIAKFRKAQKKLAMRKNFENTLDIQFDEAQERLQQLMEDDPKAAEKISIKEYDTGRYVLVDAKGNNITLNPASHAECQLIYRGLTGKEYDAPKKSGSRTKSKADGGDDAKAKAAAKAAAKAKTDGGGDDAKAKAAAKAKDDGDSKSLID